MNLNELFNRPQKNIVMEGIDHPEDLIISNGSAGAERVVSELTGLGADSSTVSIKWDGFPAVMFGRDENGEIVFVDKHMFEKVSKGKMPFMTIKEYDEQRGANRSDLWSKESIIRPVLDKVVPGVPNKFWGGDLMWAGKPKVQGGAYSFKPNTVEYQVGVHSPLGKTISNSVGGIAVHTLIPGLGADDTPLRGLEGLNPNAGITFLTGEMTDKPQISVDPKLVKETQGLIKKFGPSADKFLEDLSAMKAKSVVTAMSPFITSMLEEGDIKSDIVPRFLEFLKGRLSGAAQERMLGANNDGWLYKEGNAGLMAIWTLWAAVTDLKIHVKQQIDDQQQGSEVRAIIDGANSHEGYVFGSGKDKLKLVDRLGFTRAHFGKFKVGDEEIAQKSQMPMAAFCFGRMNPPTLGHRLVMEKTIQVGGKNAYIFLSNSQSPDTDPLDPATKAAFIKKMYPKFAPHIVTDPVQGPIYAANWLYDKGFRNMTFVAGSDRLGKNAGSIEKLLNGWNSGPVRTTDNARGAGGREHVVLNFVSSGERDADASQVSGISGTLARKMAAAGDEEGFQRATGVGSKIVVNGKTLYQATRAGMGVDNKPAPPAQVPKKAPKLAKTEPMPMGEAMLPKSSFTGSKKNKLGPAGQWRNKGPKANRPAKAGDLVGGAAESMAGVGMVYYADEKSKQFRRYNENCVPVGESWELELAKAIKLLERK